MENEKVYLAKAIVKHFVRNEDVTCGIYNSRNLVGDPMDTIFRDDDLGLTIDICWGNSYFEIFGLTEGEFAEVKKFYQQLKDEG